MAAEAEGGGGVDSIVALSLIFGGFHFNAALLLLALFSFPSRFAFVVMGVMLLFIVVPLDYDSSWGKKFSRYVRKHAREYFPVTLHAEDTEAFDPKQAYVIGYEPHSAMSVGLFLLTDLIDLLPLPKIKLLASSAVFWIPFLRQIWTWLGLIPATKKNFCSYLDAGCSCVIIPGGTREMLHLDDDYEVVFLKRRKGFVRVAIEMGTPLVPVFCFGQTRVYKWAKLGGGFLDNIITKLKLAPVAFWGVYGSPIPYSLPMHMVIGKPIEIMKNPKPTTEEVDRVHGKFIFALEELFEKYKEKAGYPDLQLKVL